MAGWRTGTLRSGGSVEIADGAGQSTIQYDSAMDDAAKRHDAAQEAVAELSSDDRQSSTVERGEVRLDAARGAEARDRRLQLALLAMMLMVYGALLGFSWWLLETDTIRLTFNSMLEHLL